MTGWMIYLWTRLDVVNGFCIAGFITSLIVFGFSLLLFDERYELDSWWKKIGKKTVFAFCLFSMLFIVIPTKKDAAMIYVIPKIAQSETFNALSNETPEITRLALEALKETLQDATKREDLK